MKHREKPCKQCPFKRTAERGWLGSYRLPQEYMDSIASGVRRACHEEVKYDQTDWPQQEERASTCAGSLIFYANQEKAVPGLPRMHTAVKQVFRTRDEFEVYHSKRPWECE